MSILTREGRGSSGEYSRGRGGVHQENTHEGGEGSIRSIFTWEGRGLSGVYLRGGQEGGPSGRT